MIAMSMSDRQFSKKYFPQCQIEWKTTLFTAIVAICANNAIALSGETNKLAVSTTDYPIVESAKLDTDLDVPWSQPVKIQDPFEGEFVGIFDRHYFYSSLLNTSARVEVVSLWSPETIRFLLAYSDRDCDYSPSFHYPTISTDCLTSNAALKITDVYLKLGEEVFRLEGNNSRFQVDDRLAAALKSSPTQNVNIRLILENGETVDSEIGRETVKAWQSIY
jgi:hypothetical protein